MGHVLKGRVLERSICLPTHQILSKQNLTLDACRFTMANTSSQETTAPATGILFLESGDQLTQPEFERRYKAMSHLKKAELIEGVVYVPAALRFRSHAEPHGTILWGGFGRTKLPRQESSWETIPLYD